MEQAARRQSTKPQSLADLFALRSVKQHKLRELEPYTLEYLERQLSMFDTPGPSPLLEVIRHAMDKSGLHSKDPHEPSCSAYLERMFPYFDNVDLVEDDMVDDKSVEAMDKNCYKIPFATDIIDDERIYACVEKKQHEDWLELVTYSVEGGRYSVDCLKDFIDEGRVRLDPWLPLAVIKSKSQLNVVLKTALIYKGAVGGDSYEFGICVGQDLVRMCRLLPPVPHASDLGASVGDRTANPSGPRSSALYKSQQIVLAPAIISGNAHMDSQGGVSFTFPYCVYPLTSTIKIRTSMKSSRSWDIPSSLTEDLQPSRPIPFPIPFPARLGLAARSSKAESSSLLDSVSVTTHEGLSLANF